MIQEGTIKGGMIPKVSCCLDALEGGVRKAHIIDGRQEHAMLLEIFHQRGGGDRDYRVKGSSGRQPVSEGLFLIKWRGYVGEEQMTAALSASGGTRGEESPGSAGQGAG